MPFIDCSPIFISSETYWAFRRESFTDADVNLSVKMMFVTLFCVPSRALLNLTN